MNSEQFVYYFLGVAAAAKAQAYSSDDRPSKEVWKTLVRGAENIAVSKGKLPRVIEADLPQNFGFEQAKEILEPTLHPDVADDEIPF